MLGGRSPESQVATICGDVQVTDVLGFQWNSITDCDLSQLDKIALEYILSGGAGIHTTCPSLRIKPDIVGRAVCKYTGKQYTSVFFRIVPLRNSQLVVVGSLFK